MADEFSAEAIGVQLYAAAIGASPEQVADYLVRFRTSERQAMVRRLEEAFHRLAPARPNGNIGAKESL